MTKSLETEVRSFVGASLRLRFPNLVLGDGLSAEYANPPRWILDGLKGLPSKDNLVSRDAPNWSSEGVREFFSPKRFNPYVHEPLMRRGMLLLDVCYDLKDKIARLARLKKGWDDALAKYENTQGHFDKLEDLHLESLRDSISMATGATIPDGGGVISFAKSGANETQQAAITRIRKYFKDKHDADKKLSKIEGGAFNWSEQLDSLRRRFTYRYVELGQVHSALVFGFRELFGIEFKADQNLRDGSLDQFARFFAQGLEFYDELDQREGRSIISVSLKKAKRSDGKWVSQFWTQQDGVETDANRDPIGANLVVSTVKFRPAMQEWEERFERVRLKGIGIEIMNKRFVREEPKVEFDDTWELFLTCNDIKLSDVSGAPKIRMTPLCFGDVRSGEFGNSISWQFANSYTNIDPRSFDWKLDVPKLSRLLGSSREAEILDIRIHFDVAYEIQS